jgi:transposase
MYHNLRNSQGKIMDMPYTINPHVPKVRRDAVNLVKYRGWSMRKVALRYGVEPSTVSRWCKLPFATGFHELPTRSSRPKTSPNALKKEIIEKIIEKKVGRRRCGQVIHEEPSNQAL